MLERKIVNGRVTYSINVSKTYDNVDVVPISIGPNFSENLRTDMEALIIPPTIQQIDDTFWNCNRLVEFHVHPANNSFISDSNGVLYSHDMKTLFRVPPAFKGVYTLPKETTQIAPHAFCSCNNISEVILHDGLESIGINAFYDCSTKVPINIPDSLTVFMGCTMESTTNKNLHFRTHFIYKSKTYSYEEISKLFNVTK